MSVKIKLSFLISCIVLLLLVLNVILNDYSMQVNLRSDTNRRLLRISHQMAATYAQYAQSYELIESALDERLKAASIAAADRLGDDLTATTKAQLASVASQIEVTQVSLLTAVSDGYEVTISSDPAETGKIYSYEEVRPLNIGAPDNQEQGYSFRSGSTEPANEPSSPAMKRSYYSDSKHPFIISCGISNTQTTRIVQLPITYLNQTINGNSDILEISAFNPEVFGNGPANDTAALPTIEQLRLHALIFGTYTYRQLEADIEHVRKAADEDRSVFDYAAEAGGRPLIKSFVPVEGPVPYVVGIVMDRKQMTDLVRQQRMNQVYISAVLLLIVVICSYWLSDILLRPVRAILWKVNEVSFGRFDDSIEVNRKDELGQLAQRVNAMSKNLSIYMTKLKQAFEENRSMKEYLESFINHTTDAIHVIDLDGHVTQVNRAFEQLFGYSAEEVIGMQLPLVPEHLKAEEFQTNEWLKSGKPLSARETIRVTKEGEWLSVSVTTSPIRDKYGSIHAIASITRDMTSRNKMEELLRRSEKLTTVGQLAAGVAHEIRNPLTTLRGFLQLQLETNKLNTRHVDLMLSELDRINLIVGEFLILAKPQAARFEEKDVRFILGDIVSLLDSQAHLCDIEFKTDFTDLPCRISCEENQLKQVFINVLKNAIEAMPQGGEIRIAVRPDEAGQVAVAITDYGVGIPEDMIARLGDPFFTGKEMGTGLGIMVSQRIIQSHHGTMDIRSKVDVGTTVTINLPLQQEGAEGGAEKES